MLVVVAAYLFWLDVAKWLDAVRLEKDFASYAVISFALLAALIELGFLFFRSKWLALSFSLLIALAFILNFGSSKLVFAGVLILILGSLRSRADIATELVERTKMNSLVILRRGATPLILGLFVLVSFAAFESQAFERFKNVDALPPNLEKYIRVVVENTIGQRVDIRNDAQRELIIDRVTAETFRELNIFLDPYFQYAPPLLAFTLFLILWGLSWIFIWISVWMGMLIFKVLKKSGFIRIEEKDVRAEVLQV